MHCAAASAMLCPARRRAVLGAAALVSQADEVSAGAAGRRLLCDILATGLDSPCLDGAAVDGAQRLMALRGFDRADRPMGMAWWAVHRDDRDRGSAHGHGLVGGPS